MQYKKLALSVLLPLILSGCAANEITFKYANKKGHKFAAIPDYDQAEMWYRKARDDSKEYKNIAQHNIARVKYLRGEYEIAKNIWEPLIGEYCTNEEMNPYCDQYFYSMGNVLYRLGEGESRWEDKVALWKTAIEQYKSDLALNPKDIEAQENIDFIQNMIDNPPPQNPDGKNEEDGSGENEQENKDSEESGGQGESDSEKDNQNQKQQSQGSSGQPQDPKNQDQKKNDGQEGAQEKDQKNKSGENDDSEDSSEEKEGDQASGSDDGAQQEDDQKDSSGKRDEEKEEGGDDEEQKNNSGEGGGKEDSESQEEKPGEEGKDESSSEKEQGEGEQKSDSQQDTAGEEGESESPQSRLSPQMQQQLEDYQEELQNQEQNLQQYLNRNPQAGAPNPANDPQWQDLMNDPFFREFLMPQDPRFMRPQKKSVEKDW